LQTYYVRDAEGQVRYTVDGLGSVSGFTYDGLGRQVSTRRYKNQIALTSLNSQLTTGPS
jgi:YD repeat-containing protein